MAATVPAAELPTIMDAQWNSSVGWVIGAAALVSWQAEHPELDFQKAVSAAGSKQVASLNGQCVAAAAASALALNKLHGPFFASNPLDDPAWLATVTEQMPAQPPKGLPMFLAQGMDDKVVLARTNILLNQQWCVGGVTIQSLWLPGVNHQDTSVVAGPEVIEWATARFGGAVVHPHRATVRIHHRRLQAFRMAEVEMRAGSSPAGSAAAVAPRRTRDSLPTCGPAGPLIEKGESGL